MDGAAVRLGRFCFGAADCKGEESSSPLAVGGWGAVLPSVLATAAAEPADKLATCTESACW